METTQKIYPTGDKVLVKIAKQEDKTESGIYIPDTAAKEMPVQGVVDAIGEKVNTMKVGDVVLFSKYGPDMVAFREDKFYIIKEENILAVIK